MHSHNHIERLDQPFLPPPVLNNSFVQTVLASSRFRVKSRSAMAAASSLQILTTAEGVRLTGEYSRHESRPGKGLVLLIHGWEGSSGSSYILSTAQTLFANGYDVYRLNLRWVNILSIR